MLTVVSALFMLFAFTAFADTEGIFTYTVTNGAAEISAVTPTGPDPIVIPDTLGGVPVTTLYGTALNGSAYTVSELHIPAGLTKISGRPFMNAKLAAFSVDEANPAFSDDRGVLLNKTQTALLKCPAYYPYDSYTAPAAVTSVGYGAFADQRGIKRLTLPEGVTSIGDQAFIFSSSIERIDIPDSVTTLKENCFAYATALKELTLPAGIASLPGGCISDCTALETLTILGPVTLLDYGPIDNLTSLKTLVVPASVTAVSANAFRNSEALERILFCGDTQAWENITVGDNNEPFLAARVYCDYPAETYRSLSVEETDGVLRISGSVSLPDTRPEDYRPWDVYRGTAVTLVLDGTIARLGSYAFTDFPLLAEVVARLPQTALGAFAFSGCEALNSVFLFGQTAADAKAFSDCGPELCVFSEVGLSMELSGAHQVVVGYSDGALTYSGALRQNAYDFFYALSVFCGRYGTVRTLHAERLGFEGFSVYAVDPKSGEKRPVTEDLVNTDITAEVLVDGAYVPITFNDLTDGIADGSITDFYLAVKDETHKEETETQFNIVDEIAQSFRKLLRAIVTLLNRLVRLFR